MLSHPFYAPLYLAIFCCLSLLAPADVLPVLSEKDWTSYHALHRGRGFAMGIDQTGTLDLYFIKRRARTNRTWPIQINLILERREKNKGARWVKKTIRKSGFTVTGGAKLQQEKVEFIGSITGDVQYRLNYKFHPQGVTVTAAILNNPSGAHYRLTLTSDIDSLVTVSKSYSQRELRNKTKGNLLTIETRSAKPVKIRFHEKTDLKLIHKNIITSLTLKAPKMGRAKLTWKLADPKKGKLQLNYKASNAFPHKGFTISTIIADQSKNTNSTGLILEVK